MNQKTSSCNKCGKSFTRSTGAPAVVVPTVASPAAKKCCTDHGVAPDRLQFKLQKTRETLVDNVQEFTVDMKGAKSLNAKEGYSCFQTSNDGFPTEA